MNVVQTRKIARRKLTSKKQTSNGSGNSYDRFKTFKGKQYTGMKVGRSHKWYYDKGEWKERKITPDKWEITYSVIKRRAGKAPEGSGVPIGTGYHWFILSHQFVHKLNANDYTTAMIGIKLKLAHKRADKDKWNVSESTKTKNLIRALEDFIEELKKEPERVVTIPLEFKFTNKLYKGFAVPMMESCSDGVCKDLDITLNDKHIGIIRNTKDGWRMPGIKPQAFINTIGKTIYADE
jgi:hypothetical protein